MSRLAEGVVGATSAGIVLTAWERWPGKDAFKAKLLSATSFPLEGEAEKSPLAFIEHYHWGMTSFLVGGSFFDAGGAVLIGSEFFGEQPFGIGKSEWEVRGNIMLTLILSVLLSIKYGGEKQ